MLETSCPDFPGMDCPSGPTDRTIHRQFTIAALLISLIQGMMGQHFISYHRCFGEEGEGARGGEKCKFPGGASSLEKRFHHRRFTKNVPSKK